MKNFTHKRWTLLAIACLINLCTGSVYAWSVFAGQKAQQLSELTGSLITAGDLAIAFSVCNGLAPIPMILGGYFVDRLGPKAVIVVGGLFIGAGMFFSGASGTFLSFLISYGLIFGLGLGFTYGAAVNNTIKFFPDHRGLAGGLTTGFYGLCSVIVPPIGQYLIATNGISFAFESLGIVFGTVIVLGGLLSIKCPPDFVPQGWTKPTNNFASLDVDTLSMLKRPRFWLMFAFLLCCGVSGMMILSHAAVIARTQIGYSAAAAAGAVAFIALVNTFARLVTGVLSDKFGQLPTLIGAAIGAAAGLSLLVFADADHLFLFYAAFACIGFAFGSLMGIYPGFTAAVFGTKHNSTNYGLMFYGFSLAGIIGPWLIKVLAIDGSYSYVYLCGCALTCLGVFIGFVLLKINKEKV